MSTRFWALMRLAEPPRFGSAMWRPLAVALALLMAAAACASDGGGDAGSPAAVPDDGAASPTAETATATPMPDPTTAPTAAPETGDEPDEQATPDDLVNADPVLVDLADFEITTATTVYKAGTINFEIGNTSDTPHEFGIARGPSYDDLPLLENGSIDEETLGSDFLGKTAVVDQVLSPVRQIAYDLEPGQYVFFCNLVVGPVSHAARGQVLSVTVVD